MDMLIYLTVLFTSFLGLIAGMIISKIAVEEIIHASRYLKYMNLIIIPFIILLATFSIHKIYSMIFAGIVLLSLVIFRDRYNDAWTYSCMGALIFISTISGELLNVASMIFIYGISIATINSIKYYKNKINGRVKLSEELSLLKNLLWKYSYYLIIGISFYLAFSYLL